MLIEQVHTEDEYLHFIRDISPYLKDPRYIRVDGKPLLIVYRVNLLPNPQKAAEIWRSECEKMGLGEIYLVAAQSFDVTDPRPYGFDAAVQFPPHGAGSSVISQASVKINNSNFRGYIYDYCSAARIMLDRKPGDYTLFKTVMVSWDNTARKQNDPNIFINSTPSAYQEWLEGAVKYSQEYLPEDKRFVFINAWNEWAEGTHLEPDRKYGYAYLQATASALSLSKK
jgi:lipopolysaccharide biosynthesis protein